MAEQQEKDIGYHIVLLICAVVMLVAVGFGVHYIETRNRALSDMAVRVATLEEFSHKHEAAVAELRTLLASRPAAEANPDVEAMKEWIAAADMQLGLMFQQLFFQDHTLAIMIMQLQAELEAVKAQVAAPPVVAKPPSSHPSSTKPRKVHPQHANKRCNKPVTVCRGENPIVCEVR